MRRRTWLLLLAAPLLARAPVPAHAAPSAFSLTDTRGEPHSLARHEGKWVLVNLWATWCVPCLAEMPELEALHRQRTDVVVLGVAVDGQNARRVVRFAEKLGVTYPIIAADTQAARLFEARGFPTSILYDRSGRPVLVKEGATTREEIEAAMR